KICGNGEASSGKRKSHPRQVRRGWDGKQLPGVMETFRLAGGWIEEIRVRIGALLKIEHVIDRTRNGIEGAVANALAAEPVVFDEADDGSLVGSRMVDEVGPRPGRDNH